MALRQFDRSGISKGLVVCAMRAGFGSEFKYEAGSGSCLSSVFGLGCMIRMDTD